VCNAQLKNSIFTASFLILITMENTASNYDRVGIDDMKKNYPDEWILLGNPEMDEYEKILSGVVLYHSPDKRELALLGGTLIKNYETTAHFFNRVTPRPKRGIIASVFSSAKI
jgi:hypothetical protein